MMEGKTSIIIIEYDPDDARYWWPASSCNIWMSELWEFNEYEYWDDGSNPQAWHHILWSKDIAIGVHQLKNRRKISNYCITLNQTSREAFHYDGDMSGQMTDFYPFTSIGSTLESFCVF